MQEVEGKLKRGTSVQLWERHNLCYGETIWWLFVGHPWSYGNHLPIHTPAISWINIFGSLHS